VRPENRAALSGEHSRFRDLTMDALRNNDELAWETADKVCDKLIAKAEALGTDTLLLSFNRDAMPRSKHVDGATATFQI